MPELGRYTSADAVGLFADNMLYPYAINNPIYYVDMNGMLIGMEAGESYGAEAAEYWANQTQSGIGWQHYAGWPLGLLASLWSNDKASTRTTMALLGGLAAGAVAQGYNTEPSSDPDDIEPENPNYGAGESSGSIQERMGNGNKTFTQSCPPHNIRQKPEICHQPGG